MVRATPAAVTEQTGLLVTAGAATRVFLGVSVTIGFFASAMAAFMIPVDWGTGGGAGGNVSVPLKIARVLDVKSIMNQAEAFSELTYTGGSTTFYNQTSPLRGVVMNASSVNQPLKITLGPSTVTNTNSGPGVTSFSIGGNSNSGGGATSFSIESIAPTATSFSIESIAPTATSFSIESIATNTTKTNATSFSIEPYPQAGFPAQMVVLTYKLAADSPTAAPRMLTICIGHSSATSLYVGPDGSTYANSSFGALNGRTTSEPCSSIKRRAMTVTQVTGGSIGSQVGNYSSGQYTFVRAFMYVAGFANGSYVTGSSQPVTLQTEAPLYAGFNFGEFPVTKPAAPAIISLQDSTAGRLITKNVCFPETVMDTTTGGPVYYFDTAGTPYADIFLSQPMINGSCAQAISRGLKAASVQQATGSVVVSPNHNLFAYNVGKLVGAIHGSSWTPLDNGESTRPAFPFTLVLAGGSATDIVSVPRVDVTLNYNQGQTLLMCFPGNTHATPGKYAVYYDTAGQPYYDIFLAAPITCSSVVPVITNAHVISVTTSSAVIGWDTNVASCDNVNYGTVVNALNSGPAIGTCGTTGHQATLSGLAANTTYYYEIVGPERLTSGQQTFKTLAITANGGVIQKIPDSDLITE